MATTAQQVLDYNSYVTQELAYYGNRLATKHQIGDKPSFDKEVKFMLIQAFADIAGWYLTEYDDIDNNAMTVAEFNDIQQHINKIANSFHWIVIE